ncbi:ABC transporter permease DevC [Wenzhouxiangella sp. XN201]|uniref:ABC transporter permease DevC n=1 Tax=Wenzhouxiangella sp. XN201 TaxID=2710755 RepID=UPI001969C133
MVFWPPRPPLGWLQLKHRPLRLVVAIAGITFAVLLIMMQLGFRSALFESAVRFHEQFNYDIALFSTDSVFIVRPQDFSIRRLYQALADEDVAEVMPVYIFPAVWKNPWNNDRRSINAVGFDPQHDVLDAPGFAEARAMLTAQDVVAFDAAARPEFGPVAEELQAGEPIVTEINDRRTEVVALFEMGTSFGIDGTVLTSDDNWLRLFPDRSRNRIHLGLIRLEPGADATGVRDRLEAYLPEDVLVLTKKQFVEREQEYWNSATPIGYIFAFGAIMGFIVGGIIVYQILFADVSEHLNEYATLRAIGFKNRFIYGIVLQQATILAVLGYIPGLAIVHWLYGVAGGATRLPLYITVDRAVTVFVMTLAMCAISALLAIRKIRRVDPAEVF